jgi:hypothetical protein
MSLVTAGAGVRVRVFARVWACVRVCVCGQSEPLAASLATAGASNDTQRCI